eukprot:gene18074-21594_t
MPIIPDSVTYLEFRNGFRTRLTPGTIPQSVTELIIRSCNFKELNVGVIPNGLVSLYLGEYNGNLRCLPATLTDLDLGFHFNQRLENCFPLPSGLTSLTFDDSFNQKLKPGTLPQSLRTLELGDAFNQPIEPDSIPSSVTSLSFGRCFNQPLDNLPPSIKQLAIGRGFTHRLMSNQIPHVQSLTMPCSCDYQPTDGHIIDTVHLINSIDKDQTNSFVISDKLKFTSTLVINGVGRTTFLRRLDSDQKILVTSISELYCPGFGFFTIDYLSNSFDILSRGLLL